MAVRIVCPHCGESFRVKQEKIGKNLRCTSCRETFEATEAASAKGRRGRAKCRSG